MQIMDLFRIRACQSPREEVCLLLVVSLNRDPIARTDENFESLNDRLWSQNSAVGKGAGGNQPIRLSRLRFHDNLEGVSFAMQRLVSGAVAVCDEEGAGEDHDRHNRRKNDQP
jgi:hypothetical protein